MKKKNTALIITTSILSVVLVVSAVCAGVFFGKNAETMKSVFSNSGQNFTLSSVAEAEKAEAVENAISDTFNVANANMAEAVNEAYRIAEDDKNKALASAEQDKNDALNATAQEKAQIIEESNKALADAQIEKEQAVSDAYVNGYNSKLPNVFEVETLKDLNGLSITNENQWTQIFDAPEYEPIVEGEYLETVALKNAENMGVSDCNYFYPEGFIGMYSDRSTYITDENMISFVHSLIDNGKYYEFTCLESGFIFENVVKIVPFISNMKLEDMTATVPDRSRYLYLPEFNAKQIGVIVDSSGSEDRMYIYGAHIENLIDPWTLLGCFKFEGIVEYIADSENIGRFISKTFYAENYPVFSDSSLYNGYIATLSLPDRTFEKWNYQSYYAFTFKINGNYYNNFACWYNAQTAFDYTDFFTGYNVNKDPAPVNLCTAYLIEGEPSEGIINSDACTSYYTSYINGEYNTDNGIVFLLPNQTIFDYYSGESLTGGFTMLVFFPEEIETFEIVSIKNA